MDVNTQFTIVKNNSSLKFFEKYNDIFFKIKVLSVNLEIHVESTKIYIHFAFRITIVTHQDFFSSKINIDSLVPFLDKERFKIYA